MTQPSYVPIYGADQVRASLRLHQPPVWMAARPGELKYPVEVGGRNRGAPGPDQGFALHLARQFEPKLVLDPEEHAEDVIAGGAAQSMRRAALWGRAPMLADLEAAFTLWGYLEEAPGSLVERRKVLFSGAAHDYATQRRICDLVSEELLRMPAAELRERAGEPGAWQALSTLE